MKKFVIEVKDSSGSPASLSEKQLELVSKITGINGFSLSAVYSEEQLKSIPIFSLADKRKIDELEIEEQFHITALPARHTLSVKRIAD